jgi:type IV pilus assembly protein PilW
VANVVVSTGATPWWQAWFGIQGFDGAQPDGAVGFGTAVPSNRVNGTDSMQVQGIEGTGLSVVDHDPNSANFKINVATTTIAADDILMVCDFDHAAIFKVTNYNSSNVTVVHNKSESESPRNCSKGLGYPTVCETTGNTYRFGPNSEIARMSAVDWYIGDNGRPQEGGRSLYRLRLNANPEEIVAGVSDMQVRYREAGRSDFRDATSVGTWASVNAVMITLTLQSADQRITTDTSVNSGRLQRQFTNIVTLRNRVP